MSDWLMNRWGLILPALILAFQLFVWPAIKARSIILFLRRIIIAILLVIGVPLVLCVGMFSLPYLVVFFVRNLLIRFISQLIITTHYNRFTIDAVKITHAKINVFNKYAGSLDVFQRSSSSQDRSLLSDGDWCVIEDCIQDMRLIQPGNVSKLFLEQIETKIFASCASISVVARLRKMALKNYQKSYNKSVFYRIFDWLAG